MSGGIRINARRAWRGSNQVMDATDWALRPFLEVDLPDAAEGMQGARYGWAELDLSEWGAEKLWLFQERRFRASALRIRPVSCEGHPFRGRCGRVSFVGFARTPAVEGALACRPGRNDSRRHR